MGSVDRSLFLPAAWQSAPDDVAVPLGESAVPTRSVTELMVELAEPQADGFCLEVGTGSGYQAACLARFFRQVTTVDVRRCFADIMSQKDFCPNVVIASRDGREPDGFLYDAIVVTCGVRDASPWFGMLAEGGRLVVPVGKPFGQELHKYVKRGGEVSGGGVLHYTRFLFVEGKRGDVS